MATLVHHMRRAGSATACRPCARAAARPTRRSSSSSDAAGGRAFVRGGRDGCRPPGCDHDHPDHTHRRTAGQRRSPSNASRTTASASSSGTHAVRAGVPRRAVASPWSGRYHSTSELIMPKSRRVTRPASTSVRTSPSAAARATRSATTWSNSRRRSRAQRSVACCRAPAAAGSPTATARRAPGPRGGRRARAARSPVRCAPTARRPPRTTAPRPGRAPPGAAAPWSRSGGTARTSKPGRLGQVPHARAVVAAFGETRTARSSSDAVS